MTDETAGYTADRDLYLDKDGKVVEKDDATRSTLLVRAGMTLPRARADELGLDALAAPASDESDESDETDDDGETKATTKAPATKAVTKPAAKK